jgi:hypothetical protein
VLSGRRFIETPTHYLLNCPNYIMPRQRHTFGLNVPIPLSTELLLVGSNELTINQKTEFLSVQKFIGYRRKKNVGLSYIILRFSRDLIH